MKEATKELTEMLERMDAKFDLTEGENEEKNDVIDIPLAGDLTRYTIRIIVLDDSITILSWFINSVQEEKYKILLETLNDLNYEYRFIKFYASQNDDEKSYGVAGRLDDVYDDNYEPQETIDLIVFLFDVIEEVYPQIIKAIA